MSLTLPRWLCAALLLSAAGCQPASKCAPEPLPAGARLALTLTDLQTGVLAVAGEDGVSGPLLAATGDPLVRVGPSGLYLVERGGADVISALDLGAPSCPRWQVGLPAGTNAHDLVEVDGVLWVPAYDRPVLLGLSAADGSTLHELDLSAWAESDDGIPELDRAIWAQDRLWVSAQRLRREGTRWSSDDGLILEIDPAGPAVIDAWPTGPNPRIRAIDQDTLAVVTGLLARGPNDPDAQARRTDGALHRFDLRARTLGPPELTEASLDADLGAVIPHPDGLVLLAVQPTGATRAICLGPGGALDGPTGPAWLAEGAWDGQQVWLASRQGWADGVALPGGLLPLDPVSCTAGPLVPTALDPYDIVRLPEP